MFCEKCGTKLEESAEFCTNCGASVSETSKKEGATEKVVDKEIQLHVKPTFSFGYMVLPALLIYGIIILVISVISFMASPGVGLTILVIGFGMLAVILGIKTLLNKKQYDSYTYDFYKTKVVYKDSFLNVSEKEVKYKYIREVTMRQTFIQRFFNLGNIILFTNAETGFGNGINIMNVKDVKDIYKKVKAVIDI